jgi:hypothetical protein
VIRTALGFCRDVLRNFTWQKVLLAQLLAILLDLFIIVMKTNFEAAPPSFTWSRLVIEETMGFSVLFALLIADQAIARGARRFRAYALALVVASVFAALVQFQVRTWLGIYTSTDQPGVDAAVRRTQMVYVACDTLTYGGLFIVLYLDYRRRERLLRRVRAAELERARREQEIVRSQLAALRTDVDAVELLATLEELRRGFESDRGDVDTRLDAIIGSLRDKLAPLDAPREATA